MLQDRIARRSLISSGLKVEYSYINNEYTDTLIEYWKKIEEKFEPLLELSDNSDFKIYRMIGKHFIEPRYNKQPKKQAYSILLYGPPGTGKSTVGENIAEALRWKFITVTPSDFLAGGSAEVETRAKLIFKCLEQQKDSVILFDEIDHFLLDRDSDEYKDQTGIFQFMTPGMLPKINDLRKKKRSIFIIATNYIERIDAAIKREGRIDYQLPLMPPAYLQRINILKNTKNLKHEKNAIETTLCTYTELTSYGRPSCDCKIYHERLIEKDKSKTELRDVKKSPAIEYFLLEIISKQSTENAEKGLGFEISDIDTASKKYINHIYTNKKEQLKHIFTNTDNFERFLNS